MHDEPMRVGQAVLAELKRQQRTQTWLAEKLGLTEGHVSKRLRGVDGGEWTIAQMQAIERALGMRRGHLFVAGGYVQDVASVEAAIAADPALSPEDRDFLTAAYRRVAETTSRPPTRRRRG